MKIFAKTGAFPGLLIVSVLIFCLFTLSCAQDSIFFDVSNEPEPKDPLIAGSPTNIITTLQGQLFVGGRMSGRIFRYDENENNAPSWSSFPLPGGNLGDIATDGNNLYALIFPSGDPLNASEIRKYNIATSSWEELHTQSNYSIQTIYGAGGKIFAGAQLKSDHRNYAIMYIDSVSSSLTVIKYGTSLLKGAAVDSSGNIYLATQGSGIFRFRGESVEQEPEAGTEGANISGITETGGVIVAVSGNGSVYTGSSGRFSVFSTGLRFTGALSEWRDPNTTRIALLLMGVRNVGTSLTHGYREMVLDSSGKPSSNIQSPGDGSPTSVKNKAKYTAGIGTHPVESILQIPEGVAGGSRLDYPSSSGDAGWEPPIFASTPKDGLWSYRNGEWNAEE